LTCRPFLPLAEGISLPQGCAAAAGRTCFEPLGLRDRGCRGSETLIRVCPCGSRSKLFVGRLGAFFGCAFRPTSFVPKGRGFGRFGRTQSVWGWAFPRRAWERGETRQARERHGPPVIWQCARSGKFLVRWG